MDTQSSPIRRTVVIGGGISGLAAAHRLVELQQRQVLLVEAGPRLGGALDTVARDGFLIERSADNFIANVPWAVDLCRRVGLGDELLETNSHCRRAFVVHRGRLHAVPAGLQLMAPARLWPMLASRVLSPVGKLRLLAEYFVPRRTATDDESLAAFARRRLGREMFERLVQPLVGGIYSADPEKLSLRATMPRFLEMEQRHGGLIRAMRRDRTQQTANADETSGARYALFVAPRRGMSSLVEAVAARLPDHCVRLNTRIERIERLSDGSWRLSAVGATQPHETIACDELIVATPAHQTALLVRDADPVLADHLARIEYAGTAVVSLGFCRDQIAHRLDGFGFVVPAIEHRGILAASFASVKFAGRAPDGCVLIRVFLGGACQGELVEAPDERLCAVACQELAELLGTRGAPLLVEVARWPRSMPQYHLGHCQIVEEIETRSARLPGFALAGSYLHGVGIPHCVHGGERAAEYLCSETVTSAS